ANPTVRQPTLRSRSEIQPTSRINGVLLKGMRSRQSAMKIRTTIASSHNASHLLSRQPAAELPCADWPVSFSAIPARFIHRLAHRLTTAKEVYSRSTRQTAPHGQS